MGLGCGKAQLRRDTEDVAIGSERQRTSEGEDVKKKEEAGREQDRPEAPLVHGNGHSSRPVEKKKKQQETDVVSEVLKRAAARGTEERAAASTPPPHGADAGDGSDGEDGRDILVQLLGGPASTSAPSSTGRGSSSSASSSAAAATYSPAVVRAAARAGVPLPSMEPDDKAYGALDAYADDLLGTPDDKRPAGWRRPSLEEAEAQVKAALKGTMPPIIYSDGRRGPPPVPPPRRKTLETLQEELLKEVPAGPRPSLVPPPGATKAAGSSASYMSNVLNGWASIDGEEVQMRVSEDNKPAPKRKAAAYSAG